MLGCTRICTTFITIDGDKSNVGQLQDLGFCNGGVETEDGESNRNLDLIVAWQSEGAK